MYSTEAGHQFQVSRTSKGQSLWLFLTKRNMKHETNECAGKDLVHLVTRLDAAAKQAAAYVKLPSAAAAEFASDSAVAALSVRDFHVAVMLYSCIRCHCCCVH